MSDLRVTNLRGRTAGSAPTLPDGVVITGVATASSFVGDGSNLTGISSVSFATTAFALEGTPDIAIRNLTGVAATFSGNVSIAGTLTYEDATNVDSIGLITARSGIDVLAGGINAVGVITATSFSGPLTGNADTATTSGISTVSQGLTGTPNIVVGFTTVGTALSLTGYYVENITAMGALDVDCSTANYFTKTINGNSTFTFSNVPSSSAYSFILELTHTSGTVTWPSEVKWPADTAPTLTTGKTHIFIFITDDGGTRWRGSSLVDYVD